MSAAAVSAADRGFLFGDGVFDTMLVAGGRGLAVAAHRARLVRHAAAIGILVDQAAIEAAQAPALAGEPPSILRTTVTRGVAARGLWPASQPQPTVLCSRAPFDPALIGAPARLVTATIPRNERSPLSRLKSLNYLDNILAARAAAEAGFDDALILNTQGLVACSTIANVFALFGATLLTPPLDDGAMDGVMRALLLAAPPAGIVVRDESLTPEHLARADAVFLTNSVRFVRPVTALDGATFAIHRATAELLDALQRELCRDADLAMLFSGRTSP